MNLKEIAKFGGIKEDTRIWIIAHVLHDFITCTPFEEKSSDHFKDLHKMELLTNFDISLTSFLGRVMN